MLKKLKQWNWTIFFVILCTEMIGAMGNKSCKTFTDAFLLGLIAGIVLGIPLAWLTKDEN